MSSYQYPPPPPGGYPATGYPQPGYPQPGSAPQQVPAGGGYPPQQQPPGYPPQQQPPPAGPPQSYAIDDASVAAQYKKAKEEMQGGGVGFFKLLGPQGQKKWDSSIPVGYEGSSFVHICGPWAPNKPMFVTKTKYFWKSRNKPAGTSIIVPPGQDLIAQAIELGAQNPDPMVQKFIKDFGKPRANYVYNLLQLDNVQLHYGQDGVMRPLILDEGKQLHTALGDVFNNAEGASNIVDYQRGRPVRIVRKKTGPRDMDVEWTAMPSMNPSPVPQEFWPALQNLWDLERFVKYPTIEEQQQAIIDMGLPMPGQPMQMQVPMSYNPGAAPPYPNPYQQQPPPQMMPPQGQQMMPPQAPPPAAFGPPPTAAPPPPAMTPPPVYSSGQAQMPPQAAQTAPPQSAPPQGLAPPPISSENPQMPPPGGPPPVPETQAPPPQQTQMPVAQPQAQGQAQGSPPVLSLPLPPGTTLPDGRERCFGQFNQTDNFCIMCPDWVKGQCQRLSPQQQQAQPADGGLAALQQQMQGQQPQG